MIHWGQMGGQGGQGEMSRWGEMGGQGEMGRWDEMGGWDKVKLLIFAV